MEKIILYGGTFDPVHNGHLAIAAHAKSIIKPDRFIWIPTGTNPFKKNQIISSSTHRINMLKLAIPEGDEISEFETNREQLSYTKDTVDYFSKKFPNSQLYLLLGSDLLASLHKWEGIENISKQTQIIVAKRSKNFSKINLKKYHGQLLDNKILEFSSTEVRKGHYDNVPLQVRKYFASNFLYLESLVRTELPIQLSKHCFATASLAGEYAKANQYPWAPAYYAGLIHDFAKRWSEAEYEKIFTYHKFEQKLKTHEYHQWAVALWYKYVYLGENEEVFRALANHTTLDLHPIGLLDKIVFLADKLCEGRKFEGIQSVRKLAFENLDAGFKNVLEVNLKFLEEKQVATDQVRDNYRKLIYE